MGCFFHQLLPHQSLLAIAYDLEHGFAIQSYRVPVDRSGIEYRENGPGSWSLGGGKVPKSGLRKSGFRQIRKHRRNGWGVSIDKVARLGRWPAPTHRTPACEIAGRPRLVDTLLGSWGRHTLDALDFRGRELTPQTTNGTSALMPMMPIQRHAPRVRLCRANSGPCLR